MSPTHHAISQIRAVLETCAVEMTFENYTACHEREMEPVHEFAQQSPMQVQLMSTYDAWAKELFACAEVRARMQATCTQTIIDSFKAEYVPLRLTILTRAWFFWDVARLLRDLKRTVEWLNIKQDLSAASARICFNYSVGRSWRPRRRRYAWTSEPCPAKGFS
jgi:hypothetical protein